MSKNRHVLLLEAGHSPEPYNYPRIISNSDVLGANLNPEFEWGYKTKTGYIDHEIGAIRGKILGGSSAVNGAVAIRSRPEDFKRWNLPGWSYEDLLPSFKKLETRHGGEAIHGVLVRLCAINSSRYYPYARCICESNDSKWL